MARESNGPDWEAIARRELQLKTERHATDLRLKLMELAQAVGPRGTLTQEEVTNFRAELEVVLHTVEDEIAPLVDGIEPWRVGHYIRDTGQAAEFLDLTVPQVNEATGGAVIEVTDDVVRDLCNGQVVEAETPAGIRVTLQPTSPGETNNGP